MTKKLEFFESLPSSNNKAKQLVVFLHGYGANGQDLLGLSHEFCRILPDAHFISPNAPNDLENPMWGGYQWFSLFNCSPAVMYPQILDANNILDKFIEEQLERFNLTRSDLILVGFSQGSMMAMYNSLRHHEEIKGILSYSGRLILPSLLGEKIKSKSKICLIHGKQDDVVPFENFLEAKKSLDELIVPFEAHGLEGLSHSIDHHGLRIGRDFLAKLIS